MNIFKKLIEILKFLFSIKNAPLPIPPTPIPPIPSPPSPPTESSKIIDLTNKERTNRGLQPLKENGILTKVSQSWAEHMAKTNSLQHGNVGVRLTEAGYSWSNCGENIAWNYANAESVVKGWMNSAGHRANILNSSYAEIGIGIAKNSRGELYHCQDFGRSSKKIIKPGIKQSSLSL